MRGYPYLPTPPHREPEQVRDVWSAIAIMTFISSILFCFVIVTG